MKISVTTTANGMIVTDLESKQVLTWVDVVEIGFESQSGRTVTYLGTYSDTAIEVTSTPPATPTPTPAPTTTPTPPATPTPTSTAKP